MKLFIKSKNIDFHQLVENSFNSILIVDQYGEILYCNKSCLNLFKLTNPEEIISKPYWLFLPPEYHQESKHRLQKILKDKERFTVEIKMVCSDGEVIYVETMSQPFYLENQPLVQVTMQNITNRKIAEKLLTDKEKMASMGQVAAGIAHEIKNPLTSVKGFIQLLKEQAFHPYLDIVEDELTKALNTIQELLQVAKPDLQNEPLVPIDFCKELASIASLFQDRLYEVEIELDLNNSDNIIVGKKNLMQKALFNIIKNALEAMENKGKIRIEHYEKDEFVHIKVSDSGVGIPKEKIKLLGTPFFSTKTEGTGLGLTQVFTAIHEHHGIISIESEVGKGTTFYIQLPFNKV